MLGALRQRGCTIIVSTHLLAGIEQHVDRVAILRQGYLQVAGPLEELRRRSELPHRVRARGQWSDGFWSERLAKLPGVRYQSDGEWLELSTPARDKLSVLRQLLTEPGTEDLSVEPPSLEMLYRHYNTPREEDNDA